MIINPERFEITLYDGYPYYTLYRHSKDAYEWIKKGSYTPLKMLVEEMECSQEYEEGLKKYYSEFIKLSAIFNTELTPVLYPDFRSDLKIDQENRVFSCENKYDPKLIQLKAYITLLNGALLIACVKKDKEMQEKIMDMLFEYPVAYDHGKKIILLAGEIPPEDKGFHCRYSKTIVLDICQCLTQTSFDTHNLSKVEFKPIYMDMYFRFKRFNELPTETPKEEFEAVEKVNEYMRELNKFLRPMDNDVPEVNEKAIFKYARDILKYKVNPAVRGEKADLEMELVNTKPINFYIDQSDVHVGI